MIHTKIGTLSYTRQPAKSPIEHLHTVHAETKILNVKQSLGMRGTQFLPLS